MYSRSRTYCCVLVGLACLVLASGTGSGSRCPEGSGGSASGFPGSSSGSASGSGFFSGSGSASGSGFLSGSGSASGSGFFSGSGSGSGSASGSGFFSGSGSGSGSASGSGFFSGSGSGSGSASGSGFFSGSGSGSGSGSASGSGFFSGSGSGSGSASGSGFFSGSGSGSGSASGSGFFSGSASGSSAFCDDLEQDLGTDTVAGLNFFCRTIIGGSGCNAEPRVCRSCEMLIECNIGEGELSDLCSNSDFLLLCTQPPEPGDQVAEELIREMCVLVERECYNNSETGICDARNLLQNCRYFLNLPFPCDCFQPITTCEACISALQLCPDFSGSASGSGFSGVSGSGSGFSGVSGSGSGFSGVSGSGSGFSGVSGSGSGFSGVSGSGSGFSGVSGSGSGFSGVSGSGSGIFSGSGSGQFSCSDLEDEGAAGFLYYCQTRYTPDSNCSVIPSASATCNFCVFVVLQCDLPLPDRRAVCSNSDNLFPCIDRNPTEGDAFLREYFTVFCPDVLELCLVPDSGICDAEELVNECTGLIADRDNPCGPQEETCRDCELVLEICGEEPTEEPTLMPTPEPTQTPSPSPEPPTFPVSLYTTHSHMHTHTHTHMHTHTHTHIHRRTHTHTHVDTRVDTELE